jgi:hypothetical protein
LHKSLYLCLCDSTNKNLWVADPKIRGAAAAR